MVAEGNIILSKEVLSLQSVYTKIKWLTWLIYAQSELNLVYTTQEVTKLTMHVDSSLKIPTMGILWGAGVALWPYLVHRAPGTELLFILWRAQDRPWHRTQTWQASRGHIPKYVRVRACYEPRHAQPPISRDRGEHEMLGWC